MFSHGEEKEETSPRLSSTTRRVTTHPPNISRPASSGHINTQLDKQEQELNSLGRLRNDTDGEERDWSGMIGHAASVCGFFSGGFLCVGADWVYSSCTGQPRGLGEEKPLKPGTNFLKSITIVSRLTSSSNDAGGDDDDIKSFLRRYYAHCKIFDSGIRGEALQEELDTLMDQLYEDISYRNARKTGGDRLILWAATFLAAAVSIISFVRNIIHSRENSASTANLAINYTEGGGALFVLILTQITNRKTQADEQAAQALIKVRKWAKAHVQERLKTETALPPPTLPRGAALFGQKIPVAFPPTTRMPIDDALFDQRYLVDHRVNNLDHSLFEAIAKLRTTTGVPTSLFQINSQLNAFLDHATADASKPLMRSQASVRDLEAQQMSSLEMIEKLSLLYDCPIFIIYEKALETGTHCRIINEVAPEASAGDDAIDNPETHQKEREARTMILYSAEPDTYQAVNLRMQKPFGTIKKELVGLAPAERASHVYDEKADEEVDGANRKAHQV